jgi:LPPG:FO 2-phospho-L-lactate transferase
VNVVVLAGGVGGARFLRGLVEVVDPITVAIVGNVADDIEVLGLHVSPDLDTILYTLSGRSDEERGWGRADETWQALATVAELGGESWFGLGDLDVGLHLVRTEALRAGEPLSAVTGRIARAFGLESALLPATDDRLRDRKSVV